MKLLVTGASGFIGKNILRALPRDWPIVATFHRDAGFPDFLRVHDLSNVRPVRIDLADPDAVRAASLGSFDACVYLAANGDPAYSVQAPLEDLRANVQGLINLVSAARFGQFVFFSSGAVYDGLRGAVGPENAVRPTLPYAISKWAAERYVMHAQKHGRIEVASIVRFFGAYGPLEPARKIYGKLVRQFAFTRSPRFTIRGDGRNLIDAMYIDDAVRAVLVILAKARTNQTFDLCSGRPLTLEALVRQAAKVFEMEARIEYVGEVPEYIEFRSEDATMDKDFGFACAVDLPEGLRRFRDWMAREDTTLTVQPLR